MHEFGRGDQSGALAIGSDDAFGASEFPDEAAHLRHLLVQARKREGEARRAVGLLNAIVKMLPVGITVQGDDGTVILSNELAGKFAATSDGSDDPPREAPGGPAAPELETATAITTEERVIDGGSAGARTFLVRERPARVLDRSLRLSATFDFTARKQAEAELSKRAYFDSLTGLPNAALIEEQVRGLVSGADGGRHFALAFLDLDNFKQVNDYYTHAIGDTLLIKVAQRIAGQLRPSDLVGCLGGDKFLIIIRPLAEEGDLERPVEAILQDLKEPFLIDGFEILTSASVGVSIHPDHGTSYETLRRAAETAMYRVKAGAKGAAMLFDTDMGRAVTARMAQEQRLRLAVRDGRFCCAFQPKVDIRTQEVVGVEALIRLRGEDGLIQGPGEFIGLAIELGLIDDITYLLLDEIMRSMDLIDDAFGRGATISINVAAKRAGDQNFMSGFCGELRSTGCASRFMVEVTEEAFLATSLFQSRFLPMLRGIGVRVSVDDFGTGYSSLATLADVTADEIKIDRSFITGIHQRPRSQSVLKAIEALSDALNMTMIAEGVETFEEVAYLQAATRIRYAQGFYFANPIFLDELASTRRIVGESRSHAMARSRSSPRG